MRPWLFLNVLISTPTKNSKFIVDDVTFKKLCSYFSLQFLVKLNDVFVKEKCREMFIHISNFHYGKFTPLFCTIIYVKNRYNSKKRFSDYIYLRTVKSFIATLKIFLNVQIFKIYCRWRHFRKIVFVIFLWITMMFLWRQSAERPLFLSVIFLYFTTVSSRLFFAKL